MRSLENPRTYWLVAVLALGVWVLFGWVIAPQLILSGYREESFSFINRAFGGRGEHPVDVYLHTWARLRLLLSGALAVVLVLGRVVLRNRAAIAEAVRREIRSWRDPQSCHLRPGQVLLLAVSIGIVAGFGELLIMAFRMGALGYVGWRLSPERVWMIPLGSALFYLAAGGLLAGLGFASMMVRSFSVVAFLLVWLAADHWLEAAFTGLHWVGAAVLGAGIAVRAVQSVRPRATRLVHALRRSGPILMGVVWLTWLGQGVAGRVSEWRVARSLPAAPGGAPNVLFVVWDTVRAPSLSLYGYDRATTSNLDSLARSGTTYDMALAPAPWTLPSHASMFTGRQPHETSVSWREALDGELPTLAEVLGRHGYVTGAFVANFFFLTEEYGVDRGFMRFRSLPVSLAQMIRNGWRTRSAVVEVRQWLGITGDLVTKDAPVVNGEFLDWVDRRSEGDPPFFAFLNYMDAHTPYDPPAPFNTTFTGVPPGRETFDAVDQLSRAQLDTLRDAYDNAIAYLDDQFGQLVRGLRERGLLENTLLIVASDHGESFGEQHPAVVEHGTSLYLPSLHVPLVLVQPGRVPAGRRIPDPVSLRAIPATVLRLLGIDAPGFGDPLPLGEESSASREPILSELQRPDDPRPEDPGFYGDMQSLLDDSLHYIRRGDGKEEVYHVRDDPWELNDLAATPDLDPVMGAFRRALERLVARTP